MLLAMVHCVYQVYGFEPSVSFFKANAPGQNRQLYERAIRVDHAHYRIATQRTQIVYNYPLQ
jgi:hypothetical protein